VCHPSVNERNVWVSCPIFFWPSGSLFSERAIFDES
jgi:hypothetical protein